MSADISPKEKVSIIFLLVEALLYFHLAIGMDGATDIDAGSWRLGTESAERVVFHVCGGRGHVADALAVPFVGYQLERVVYWTLCTCIVDDAIVGHRPTDLAR